MRRPPSLLTPAAIADRLQLAFDGVPSLAIYDLVEDVRRCPTVGAAERCVEQAASRFATDKRHEDLRPTIAKVRRWLDREIIRAAQDMGY